MVVGVGEWWMMLVVSMGMRGSENVLGIECASNYL
jgi:hypothetical protein